MLRTGFGPNDGISYYSRPPRLGFAQPTKSLQRAHCYPPDFQTNPLATVLNSFFSSQCWEIWSHKQAREGIQSAQVPSHLLIPTSFRSSSCIMLLHLHHKKSTCKAPDGNGISQWTVTWDWNLMENSLKAPIKTLREEIIIYQMILVNNINQTHLVIALNQCLLFSVLRIKCMIKLCR